LVLMLKNTVLIFMWFSYLTFEHFQFLEKRVPALLKENGSPPDENLSVEFGPEMGAKMFSTFSRKRERFLEYRGLGISR
jgi:hypothetical protein